MKTFIASALALLIGMAVGSCIGYRYYERHIISETTKQMMELMESSDRLQATRGIQGIQLIEAGDTNRLIEIFAGQMADFYSEYGKLAHNDDRTMDTLARIARVAKTNQVVAAQIKSEMNYGEVNTKAH
jgi:hypothetical protein